MHHPDASSFIDTEGFQAHEAGKRPLFTALVPVFIHSNIHRIFLKKNSKKGIYVSSTSGMIQTDRC